MQSPGAGATGGVAVANEPKSWVMCVLLVFLGVAQGILTLAMATLTLGMRMLLSVSKAFVIGFLTSEITSLISYGSLSQTSSSFTLWRFAWLLLTGYAAVLLWNMLNKVQRYMWQFCLCLYHRTVKPTFTPSSAHCEGTSLPLASTEGTTPEKTAGPQARTDSKRRGKRKPQRARMLPEGAATSEAEDTPKTPVSVPREEPATTTAKSQAHRTGTTPDTAQPGGTTVGLSKKGKNRKNKKQAQTLHSPQDGLGIKSPSSVKTSAAAQPAKDGKKSLQISHEQIQGPNTPPQQDEIVPLTTRTRSESNTDSATANWTKVTKTKRGQNHQSVRQAPAAAHPQKAAKRYTPNTLPKTFEKKTTTSTSPAPKFVGSTASATLWSGARRFFCTNVVVPLVDRVFPIKVLYDMFRGNALLEARVAGMAQARPRLRGYRPVRGDGDCAFRAILWSLVEQASYRPASRAYLTQQLTTHMKSLPGWAINATHHDNRGSSAREGYAVLLDLVQNTKNRSLEEAHQICNSEQESDSMVLFLRAIVAAYMVKPSLKHDFGASLGLTAADFRLSKLEGANTVKLCKEMVLPLPNRDGRFKSFGYRQADQPHIAALAESLGMQLHVYSLHMGYSHTVYQEDSKDLLVRIVNKGAHYDLVYT